MLERPLRLLEHVFPASGHPVTESRWNKHISGFCEELNSLVNDLLEVAKLSVPSRVFSESKQELLFSKIPSIVVSEFRLRPETRYYESTGQPIPLPENPSGRHATGIAFNVSLCRGYPARNAVRRPSLSVEFSIWGRRERACFQDLLADHRRMVGKLLAVPDLEFRTACVFENIDRAKGIDVFKKLELYYQNKIDEENNFTIEKAFGAEAIKADIVGTLLPLLGLYDASLGYCRPRKATDRILDYVSLVHNET